MDDDFYADPFHAQRPAVKDRLLHPLKYLLDLKGRRGKFSIDDSSHARRPNAKDRPPRPHRYLYIPRRLRFILLSLAVVLVLGITSVTVFMQQSSIRAQSNLNTHLAKIHTPIPTTHATTPNTSTQAPAPPAAQAPSTQAPAPPATQAPSRQAPTPTRVPPTKAPTPTPKTCPSTIQYGSQGSWVKTLQQRLNTLGWRDQEGKVLLVDGIFGSSTQYAVKRFQAAHAPPVDGIVGPITWSRLGYC